MDVDAIDARDTGAIFSPCRRWRYILWRRWDVHPSDDRGICAFIGLNPSTADETKNDPTITRCVRYAKDWGYSSVWMLNLFAFRATEPRVMKANRFSAVGPLNDEYLAQACRHVDVTVAAWGTHGWFMDRHQSVITLLNGVGVDLHALKVTKGGFPSHPLYLSSELRPQMWRPRHQQQEVQQ